MNKRIKGSLNEFEKIANKENCDYILNFDSINLYKKDSVDNVDILVQLYEKKTNNIVINSYYNGDWYDHKMLCCENHTIECTINTSIALAVEDIIEYINSRR